MGQYFKAYVENSASKSLGKMIEFGYICINLMLLRFVQ